MSSARLPAALVVLSLSVFSVALGAEQQIIGKRLVVEASPRSVTVLAREKNSDIAGIVGDPTANGATLRVILKGGQTSDETYSLLPGNWTGTNSGFRYIEDYPFPTPSGA